MRRVSTTVLSIGLMVLAVSPAFAQRQPGRGMGGRQMGPAALLAMDKVQTEIKITDDEKAAVTKITDKYKDDIAAAGQDRDKRAELVKNENADLEKALPDILKADQLKRFKQLEVQAAGLQAFSKDDVVTALKLTDDQKTAIKATTDGLQKDMQDLFANAGTGTRPDFTKIAGMRKDALDKVVNGLTDDQKKTWKDLTGDTFEFPAPMRGNRGAGGNRGNRGTPPATPPAK